MARSVTLKISARAKRMRLTVHPSGEAVLTVPQRHTSQAVEAFLSTSRPWLERALRKAERLKDLPVIGGGKRHFEQHKAAALSLCLDRVAEWNSVLNLKYAGLSVRNQKTRWGSCSRHGRLAFNYKILFLPRDLQDYIVVHELAHLRHFNHSHLFWNLVESIVPDYKERRKRLRTFRFA